MARPPIRKPVSAPFASLPVSMLGPRTDHDALLLHEFADYQREPNLGSIELERSILANGLRRPIITYGDDFTVLDGGWRAEICSKHGLPFYTQRFNGTDEDAVQFLADENLARQSFTPQQRAMYAAHLTAHGWTQYAAAQQAGISKTTVRQAQLIQDMGTPELQQVHQQGGVSTPQAAEIAKQAPEEQERILEEIKDDDARGLSGRTQGRRKTENFNQFATRVINALHKASTHPDLDTIVQRKDELTAEERDLFSSMLIKDSGILYQKGKGLEPEPAPDQPEPTPTPTMVRRRRLVQKT